VHLLSKPGMPTGILTPMACSWLSPCEGTCKGTCYAYCYSGCGYCGYNCSGSCVGYCLGQGNIEG